MALLQRHPEVAEYYRRRFRHVLVDEYQDTNHAQYVLIRELVGSDKGQGAAVSWRPRNSVVGDADQSIYAFRGATIRNIEEFERDFPDAETILLEQNYRSTQTILSANAVIARNTGRREKRLWTDSGDGELIVGYVADSDRDEAAFIGKEIESLTDYSIGGSSSYSYGDVAVFYRTNTGSRPVKKSLCAMAFRTRWSAVPGSTSAKRSATSWPICGWWPTDDSVSLRRIVNTRAAASVIAHRRVWRCIRRTWASRSTRRCGGRRGRVPLLNTRANRQITAFVRLIESDRPNIWRRSVPTIRPPSMRPPRAATSVTSSTRSSSAPGIAVNWAAQRSPGRRTSRQSRRTRLRGREFSLDAAQLAEERDDTGDDDPEGLREERTGVAGRVPGQVSLVADADGSPTREKVS